MARIDFDDVTVAVDGNVVLHNITLGIDDGEFVGVIGPSGSGKTTLLRTLAGFTDVVEGRVLLDGIDVTQVKTADRDIGMVFQDPVLFGNRNVRRNVSFPLEIQKRNVEEIAQRVNAEVRSMHIEHLLLRHPKELSRGEAQLVQIARAMVRTPRVLLLDEPLASLDVHLQARMRAELSMLQAGYGVTTVMTTNDPNDAVSMPSRLIVVDSGCVVQIDTPAAVRKRPATVDAAVSTGECWLLPATVLRADEGFWLRFDGRDGEEACRCKAWAPALSSRVGEAVVIGMRSDGVHIVANGTITARIRRVLPGSGGIALCAMGGRDIGVIADAGAGPDDIVNLRFDEFVVFDGASGRSICSVG
jgi:ABC-type sugar transport system ATPase subunit